jgi:hypothetical protein
MIDFLTDSSMQKLTAKRPPSLALRLTPSSTIEATNPPWLRSIEKRVNTLLNLPENWDSYGAPRISAECVMAAFSLVLSNVVHETPAPQFVPTSRGGIQVEWHIGGVDLELVFDPFQPAYYYYCSESREIEGEVGDEASMVGSLLRALPTRNDPRQAR